MAMVDLFEIILDDEIGVFYPGQLVSGTLQLDVNDDITTRSIRVFLRGIAKINFTEEGKKSVVHNDESGFFEISELVYGSESDLSRDVLPAGSHDFRFSINIPLVGVSTSFESANGFIRYWVTGEIDDAMGEDKLQTKKAFTLITPIDVNQPLYKVPSGGEELKFKGCFLCKKLEIALNAQTDRIAYCPGEAIAITAKIDNNSKKVVIPEAELRQTLTFMFGQTVKKNTKTFTGNVAGDPIEPGTSLLWDSHAIEIQSTCPSQTISSFLQVDYYVRIILQNTNLAIDLPIIIGTIPFCSEDENEIMAARKAKKEESAAKRGQPLSLSPYILYVEPPYYLETEDEPADITDGEDFLMGDTFFSPKYPFVEEYLHLPPPADPMSWD